MTAYRTNVTGRSFLNLDSHGTVLVRVLPGCTLPPVAPHGPGSARRVNWENESRPVLAEELYPYDITTFLPVPPPTN